MPGKTPAISALPIAGPCASCTRAAADLRHLVARAKVEATAVEAYELLLAYRFFAGVLHGRAGRARAVRQEAVRLAERHFPTARHQRDVGRPAGSTRGVYSVALADWSVRHVPELWEEYAEYLRERERRRQGEFDEDLRRPPLTRSGWLSEHHPMFGHVFVSEIERLLHQACRAGWPEVTWPLLVADFLRHPAALTLRTRAARLRKHLTRETGTLARLGCVVDSAVIRDAMRKAAPGRRET